MSALEVPYVMTIGEEPDIEIPPVAGYIAHYDASDLATVTVNSAGIVSAMTDKTGTFNSTSVTGTCWLTKVPGFFAGRAAILFPTGASINSNCPMSDATSSYFAVIKTYTHTSLNPVIFGPSADAGLEFRVNSSAADGKLTVASADTAAIGDNDANPVTVGTACVAAAVMSASDVVIYNNLNSETDAHAVSFTAGRTLTLGRAATIAVGVEAMAGWIGEAIVYNTTLSSGDATSVISYLMSKWGI